MTKRKVQAGRRDSEGGGRTERSLGQSAEDLQKKLYRHYNETSHLNAQWRVSTLCIHSLTAWLVNSFPSMVSLSLSSFIFVSILSLFQSHHPYPCLTPTPQHSLTRVSLALSAILVFRLYKLWGEELAKKQYSSSVFTFLQANLVEALGVLSGLLIAHYIRTPLPLTGGTYVLPWSFYAALLLALLEIGVFYQHVSSNPAYVLHIDATLPVGALFFIFVWGADLMMGRSQQRARQCLEVSQRLGQTVAPHQTKVE